MLVLSTQPNNILNILRHIYNHGAIDEMRAYRYQPLGE